MPDHDRTQHQTEAQPAPQTVVLQPVAQSAPPSTEKAAAGMWGAFLQGLKSASDEIALFTGGAVGGVLASYFVNRGQKEKAKSWEKARQLYAEGRPDEARQVIIDANVFGWGLGDEAGMLYVQAYAVKAFIDALEPERAEAFLDALEELDAETLERLRLALAKIESVEERQKMFATLAHTPGDLAHRIRQHCRIAGIELDPAHNPARRFAASLGNTLESVGVRSSQRTDELVNQIDAERRRRAARRRRP